MNQKGTVGVVGKMQAYVTLAEREIATRKDESQSLQEELQRSQKLIESLHDKLRETEVKLFRLEQMERVSQFKIQHLESGGTIEVWMAKAQAS